MTPDAATRDFPRLTDLLERMQSSPLTTVRDAAVADELVPPSIAAQVVEHMTMVAPSLALDDHAPVSPIHVPLPEVPKAREPFILHDVAPVSVPDVELQPSQPSLGALMHASIRARVIAFGHERHQRSAYEIVFLMLGFAVMVLITAPPIVEIVRALRGAG